MANQKSIGYMPYSLRPQMVNPGDAESTKKIAAVAQRWETVDLEQLANHIHEHNSQFSKGVIYGVLADMVECIVELLRQGYSVDLDGLANFRLTAKSKTVDSVQEFNPATDITKINIRTSIDKNAQTAVNTNIDYVYVMTRKEQAAAKAAAKANLPQQETDGGGGTSGGDSGSDDDGSGVTE